MKQILTDEEMFGSVDSPISTPNIIGKTLPKILSDSEMFGTAPVAILSDAEMFDQKPQFTSEQQIAREQEFGVIRKPSLLENIKSYLPRFEIKSTGAIEPNFITQPTQEAVVGDVKTAYEYGIVRPGLGGKAVLQELQKPIFEPRVVNPVKTFVEGFTKEKVVSGYDIFKSMFSSPETYQKFKDTPNLFNQYADAFMGTGYEQWANPIVIIPMARQANLVQKLRMVDTLRNEFISKLPDGVNPDTAKRMFDMLLVKKGIAGTGAEVTINFGEKNLPQLSKEISKAFIKGVNKTSSTELAKWIKEVQNSSKMITPTTIMEGEQVMSPLAIPTAQPPIQVAPQAPIVPVAPIITTPQPIVTRETIQPVAQAPITAPQPIIEAGQLEQNAINRFGITKNPLNSLYITTSGEYLGNKGYEDGGEHINFATDILGEVKSNSELPLKTGMIEMIDTGKNGEFNARVYTVPTPQQIEKIRNIIKDRKEVYLDNYIGTTKKVPIESYTKENINEFFDKYSAVKPEVIKPTATYIGMQQGVPEKGIKPFALYNPLAEEAKYQKVLNGLKGRKYQKLMSADYANTGIDKFNLDKFSKDLDIPRGVAQKLGLGKITEQAGWNIPTKPTIEEFKKVIPKIEMYKKLRDEYFKTQDIEIADKLNKFLENPTDIYNQSISKLPPTPPKPPVAKVVEKIKPIIKKPEIIPEEEKKSIKEEEKKAERIKQYKKLYQEGKIKTLIRQVTGQAKVGDLIREDIALKRMMQREQSAATIAARLGRKEGEARHKAHAEEIQTRIDERAEERAKVRKLVSDIEKVRKNLSKMHPTEAEPIKQILDSIDLVKRQKTSMMQLGKIREWLQTNPEAEMPDYIMEKLQRLDHRNLNDITTDELEAIHDTIMHYAHLNKLKNQLKFKKSDRELTRAITESVSQMKAPKKIKDEIISSSKSKFDWINKPIQWFVNMMGLGHDNYSLIVETLSGPRSVAIDVLVNQIQEGRNIQLRYQQNAPEEFQKSLGGMANFKKRYGIKDIDKWLDEKTKKGNIEITRDEKIAIYLHSLSQDNMRHITNGGFAFEVGPHRDQVFKFSEKDVSDVVKSMTPVEKEYANAISEAFQREGDDIAKVFLEVNGYPMPRVEDPYFRIEPVRSTLTPTSQAKSAVEEFKNNFIRIGLNKGRLIQRTKSDLPIYLKGATKVLIQSVDWASSYIGLEKPLLNARKLMHGKGDVWKNEIIHRYGSETFKLMEEGLKDIAGSRDSLSSSEKLILWLRNNAATAMLGLPNPFPILKQMTSIPIYNIYVPAKYIIQGFIENAFKHNEIVDRHKLYSAEFTERKYGGFNREVSDIVHASSQRGQLIGGGESFKQKSMKGLQAGDLFSVVPGMHAAVLQGLAELESGKLSEYVKLAMDIEESEIPNLSATDKLKLAYKYGDWVTQHTQSTSNPIDMSSLRRAKGLTGLFTQFGSDLQAQLNIVRRLYGEAKRHKDVKHWARLIYALFIIYVVTQTEETMVDVFRRKVMGYKPKKGQTLGNQLAWGLLDKPMAQLFFLRDVYQATKSKVQNGVFAGQDIQIPVARGVNVATDALAEWVKVMTEKNIAKRDKALMSALDSSAEATTLIVGIPYSTPKGIIKRFVTPEKSVKGAGSLTLPKVGKVGGAGVSLPKIGR
jgi:hypothetical protein